MVTVRRQNKVIASSYYTRGVGTLYTYNAMEPTVVALRGYRQFKSGIHYDLQFYSTLFENCDSILNAIVQ